jgi:hypothetical protein
MADKSFVVKNGLVTGSNTTTLGTAVYVTASGNVGLSNSAPNHDLSVNGDVYLGGNTTIVGFANTSTSVSVGTTFIANTTGAYHTGTMNAASLTVGTSTVTNSTGVYTGTVNAASHTVGTYGAATTGSVVNATAMAVGNSTVNLFVNSSVVLIGGNVVANSTGANNSFNLGGISSGSYALLSGANFTGNVAIAGNLVVTGTTMYANVTNLDVADKNITVAKGAVAASTDGAGLTVDTVNIGWYYNLASNTWQSNVGITASANNLAIGNTTNRWNVYANNLVGNGASVTSVDAATVGGNSATNIWATFTQNNSFTSTISLYQPISTLASNVATLTANNTTYVNGKTEGNLNVNSASNSTNLGGVASSSYALKTDTPYIGTTAIALNRASLAQSLTGVSIDGSAGSVAWTGVTGRPTAVSSFTNDSGYITSAGTATAFSSTTLNSQFNSIGIGTAASATAGEIRATNNITAYYSDERLKENIRVIENALEKIDQIAGVFYNSNDVAAGYGYSDKSLQVGVLAGQIQKVLPMAVKPAPFDIAVDDGMEYSKSGQNYLTVQYEKIIPLLIQAIKELKTEVDELKRGK